MEGALVLLVKLGAVVGIGGFGYGAILWLIKRIQERRDR